MRCSRVAWQLQLYMDNQLPLSELRAIESHLSLCPACRADLQRLEDIDLGLRGFEAIVEPADLTMNIMGRIARSTQYAEQERTKRMYAPFRPSLMELLTAVLLATFTMLGIILEQPALRSGLPIANGHDMLSQICINLWNMLISINSNTLMLGFWIIGTILGIWITLALAGAEMRNTWLRSVLDRLPVW